MPSNARAFVPLDEPAMRVLEERTRSTRAVHVIQETRLSRSEVHEHTAGIRS